MSNKQNGRNQKFQVNFKKRSFKNDVKKGPSCAYPDRWLKYPTIGTIIPGSKFIAFKTPLDEKFFLRKPDTPFLLNNVVDTVTAAGKKLVLVIDLTNTERYYDFNGWKELNVEYVKIKCPGHTIHKSNAHETFNNIVEKFLKNCDPDAVVGVHCTHGLNRTGYLICQYLVLKENWTSENAIEAFETARGHPIERDEYKVAVKELESLFLSNNSGNVNFSTDQRSFKNNNHGNHNNRDGRRSSKSLNFSYHPYSSGPEYSNRGRHYSDRNQYSRHYQSNFQLQNQAYPDDTVSSWRSHEQYKRANSFPASNSQGHSYNGNNGQISLPENNNRYYYEEQKLKNLLKIKQKKD